MTLFSRINEVLRHTFWGGLAATLVAAYVIDAAKGDIFRKLPNIWGGLIIVVVIVVVYRYTSRLFPRLPAQANKKRTDQPPGQPLPISIASSFARAFAFLASVIVVSLLITLRRDPELASNYLEETIVGDRHGESIILPLPKPTETPLPTLIPDTPTEEPTATPTFTDTPAPNIGEIATSFATAVTPIAPTLARLTAQRINTPTPVSDSAEIQPISPLDSSNGSDRVTFEWTSNFTPLSGQGFELVFWRSGQPIANSFGLASPTTETSISADLGTLDNTLGDLLEPGTYQWGVLLVQREPYRRLQYLGGGWKFEYVRSGGTSSSGGVGSNQLWP